VARHADMWQIWLPPNGVEDWQRKNRILCEHLAAIRREDTLERAVGGRLVVRRTEEEARRAWQAEVELHQWSGWMVTFAWVGTPAQIAEGIVAYRRAGADGFTASVAAPLDLESIELLATEVRPLVEQATGA
jgi:alkanesulfonate monooxygenase SsuD/methylene tetrahydromethanopterin reductase-like flavin-dependent oxidoreductase (luciferase family)